MTVMINIILTLTTHIVTTMIMIILILLQIIIIMQLIRIMIRASETGLVPCSDGSAMAAGSAAPGR